MLSNKAKLAVAISWLSVNSALANETTTWQCFSTAQTRDQIVQHKLHEPFASMLAAVRGVPGDPIGAKLCRIDDEFVYEISLLRHDGHIVRILVNAATGKPHAGRRER